MRIGVLALQGDFEAHLRMVRRLGADACAVRDPCELPGLDGLIIPGGESTTMILMMHEFGLTGAIKSFALGGGALMGCCAGAIVLATRVTQPSQPSLCIVDVSVRRNGYGRQRDSFVYRGDCGGSGDGALEMVFIRAPIITGVGSSVRVLAEHGGHPVWVEQDRRHVVTTFHPELGDDPRVHELFLENAKKGAGRCQVQMTH